MKYTLEFKLECVDRYKRSHSYAYPPGIKSKCSFRTHVHDWVRLYDDLGIDGLRHSGTKKEWTAHDRFGLVAKVLAGRSVREVARVAHVNSGQLYQWVKTYREKGMDGLECRRGRPQKEPIMPKKKAKLTPSEREELEILRARNEYLEAENAYLKKLDALVTEREAARPKARRRKPSGD